MFQPGDKVIHRREKDPRNYGKVMPENEQHKPGWIAVYFQRKVWCKPENLRLLADTQQQKKAQSKDIKNYWIQES